MKKWYTAILMFDLCMGLLFLGLWEEKNMEVENARTVNNVQTKSDAQIVVKTANGLQDEDIRKIAITFDDGPHPSYTEQLLDGLKERGVHATFLSRGSTPNCIPTSLSGCMRRGISSAITPTATSS